MRKKDTEDKNIAAQIEVQTDDSVFYCRLSLGLMIGVGILGMIVV